MLRRHGRHAAVLFGLLGSLVGSSGTALAGGGVPPTRGAGGGGPVTGAAQTSPLWSLVLQRRDMPAAWQEGPARFISNALVAQARHDPLRVYAIHHRLAGVYTTFHQLATAPVSTLEDTVDVYQTRGGAAFGQWRFVQILAHEQGFIRAQSLTPQIGERVAIFTRSGESNDVVVLFQRGVYNAAVSVSGRDLGMTQSTAIRYARVIDSRLQRAAA